MTSEGFLLLPFPTRTRQIRCTLHSALRTSHGSYAAVGFLNKGTNKKLHTMITPSFASVSSEKQFCLGDLSVTGYDKSKFEDGMWQYGCFENDFQLKLLNNDGSLAANYFWIDYKYGFDEIPETVFEPGWYTKDGKNYTKLTKDDLEKIEIPAGQGFWTIGSSYKLVVPAPEGLVPAPAAD